MRAAAPRNGCPLDSREALLKGGDRGPAVVPGDKAPGIEQRTERILVEDSGNRIDELRVGGETRSILVQPKGGMPAYEVQPATANTLGSGTTGNRVWKVLGF